MRTSNIRLLILAAVLLVLNAWLFWLQPNGKSLDFDPKQYTVVDTTAISQVVLIKGEMQNTLTKDRSWSLNEQYATDPTFVKILMNVLNQFQLSREVTGAQREELLSRKDEAITVSVAGERPLDFSILGNPNRTIAYLIDGSDDVYQIEIPGYVDYIGSIFELTTDQWRNRQVINGNWRSIQKLTINYSDPTQPDLKIAFDKDFFKVEGVAALDSNQVVSYLNLFEHLQANERISLGKYQVYDSLMQTEPIAILTMDDIYFGEPRSIRFYPVLPGQRIQLATDPTGEPVIFEPRRVSELLAKPEDFRY